jgi:hypothetical protein
MIKSGEKLHELSGRLKNQDPILVVETIKALRDEEPFEGAIGLLADLYENTEERAVQRSIEEFFNDIRDISVREEVMAEIRKLRKQETLGMLVASCWQSGLDYSDYIADITNTFLTADYTTAIECMTLIEESVIECSREEKDGMIRLIENSPLAGLNEKSALTLELISILER